VKKLLAIALVAFAVSATVTGCTASSSGTATPTKK
jgi:hypothetical protein